MPSVDNGNSNRDDVCGDLIARGGKVDRETLYALYERQADDDPARLAAGVRVHRGNHVRQTHRDPLRWGAATRCQRGRALRKDPGQHVCRTRTGAQVLWPGLRQSGKRYRLITCLIG